MKSAVIVDIARTPSGKGKPGGALSGVHPTTLLAGLLKEVASRNHLDMAQIDDVITGCVSQIGDQSMNIGRLAVLAAGFPETVPATTIDRQCGSSQQAAHFAAQGVMAGAYEIVIACGVESMSRVPMGSSAQGGDPLVGPLKGRYPTPLVSQGVSAELIAAKWELSRTELDTFSARSHQLAAANAQWFQDEIVGVDTVDPHGKRLRHLVDETVRPQTTVEKLATLKSAFEQPATKDRFPQIDWRITSGNSSPLTDGASAVLIISEEMATKLNLTPLARFHSFAVVGSDPLYMLTGVLPATQKVLAKAGLRIGDIDAFEVNEAFAPVPLFWQKVLQVDPERVNPRGGAIALGHPLGGSGTRLLTTLVHHLQSTGGRYGLQTMCEGGGMANATVIERL